MRRLREGTRERERERVEREEGKLRRLREGTRERERESRA